MRLFSWSPAFHLQEIDDTQELNYRFIANANQMTVSGGGTPCSSLLAASVKTMTVEELRRGYMSR